MKTFKIHKLEIGSGIPKIAVPLVGKTNAELMMAANQVSEEPIDLVEWRLDFYSLIHDSAAMIEVAHELRHRLGTIPLLATLRTQTEGGNYQPSLTEYEQIYHQLIKAQVVDMIDVEVLKPTSVVTSLVEFAHQHQVRVVLSNHDFRQTPASDVLADRLQLMNDFGADIAKIAVMPQTPHDLLRLLTVSLEYRQQQSVVPLIAIGMGKLGQLTRISGEVFGSCITFGAVGAQSAPGQLDVEELRKILTALH